VARGTSRKSAGHWAVAWGQCDVRRGVIVTCRMCVKALGPYQVLLMIFLALASKALTQL